MHIAQLQVCRRSCCCDIDNIMYVGPVITCPGCFHASVLSFFNCRRCWGSQQQGGLPLLRTQVVRDVEAARKTILSRGKSVCAASLAEALSQLGYSVAMRESLGGGSGGQCLRNLRHSFLCCVQSKYSSAAPAARQRDQSCIALQAASPGLQQTPVS